MDIAPTGTVNTPDVSAEPAKATRARIDWVAITRSPAFLPGLLVTLGIAIIFLPLWGVLLDTWNSEDGYYSHGFLVPLISGYIIYRWWPRIKDTPVKPGYAAIPFLLVTLYVMFPANVSQINGLLSVGLLAVLLFSTWLIAGFQWMIKLAAPILYLAFALPLWTVFINNATNPLQIVSTQAAFQLLKLTGFYVYQSPTEPTVVYMNHFTLDVAVPCSGLKLLLALTAFTIFFVLIARLKTWANLVMLGMIPFLAILINGLRIALIGVVGELNGPEAAAKFHDYSGYITLVVCFIVLFKISRFLGWKD